MKHRTHGLRLVVHPATDPVDVRAAPHELCLNPESAREVPDSAAPITG